MKKILFCLTIIVTSNFVLDSAFAGVYSDEILKQKPEDADQNVRLASVAARSLGLLRAEYALEDNKPREMVCYLIGGVEGDVRSFLNNRAGSRQETQKIYDALSALVVETSQLCIEHAVGRHAAYSFGTGRMVEIDKLKLATTYAQGVERIKKIKDILSEIADTPVP